MDNVLKKWMEIDYYHMAHRMGFIEKTVHPNHALILDTIRVLDKETSINPDFNSNKIIAILALLWEHTDPSVYDLKDFLLKILSRIGYPTSAIIADNEFSNDLCQFSPVKSILDKCTLTLHQSQYEVSVGSRRFLLTSFQKRLWDALETNKAVGISAPTSAGKSFVILIETIEKMLRESLDIIYIVPTLSLLNQVTEDYNSMLAKVGAEDYLITTNLTVGESQAKHTIYVWTQEKAISALSTDEFSGMPQKTILVVDEIQNVERIIDDADIRAKILFDTLQELRHSPNIEQIIISGPRINRMAQLGETLFGIKTIEIVTSCSPVLSLTYSIKKIEENYYLRQYSTLFSHPYEEKIINTSLIAGYGSSSLSPEYLNYLCTITNRLTDSQNIVFAPTSAAARDIAKALSHSIRQEPTNAMTDLITYYKKSVHKNYALCSTLESGVVYHHGKLPVHVRRTIEKAIRQKMVSNVVCTTTLMQGVNLPAQNIIIRNPHLYRQRRNDSAELTSYEMSNLRGRAGRLLKDFVGRTIVLEEGEFQEAGGYEQQSLFEDSEKEISASYQDKFKEYRDEIIDAISSETLVNRDMRAYGYLVTYIRQSVLRYEKGAKSRMAETGVQLTPKQVAAIIQKLNTLSVPKHICLRNRYWDPFVLNDIYCKFSGKVPSHPTERGARSRLSVILKFLRDTESTSSMYEKYIPEHYRRGQNRGLLCATCIKWSSEKPLPEILSGPYFDGDNADIYIENTIKLLQDTVSFSVPLLIKPIIEMRNENSSMVACLQAGAYKRSTRKMIEIGVPRELAISLSNTIDFDTPDNMSSYDYDMFIRGRIKESLPTLRYWEQVQLDFLK